MLCLNFSIDSKMKTIVYRRKWRQNRNIMFQTGNYQRLLFLVADFFSFEALRQKCLCKVKVNVVLARRNSPLSLVFCFGASSYENNQTIAYQVNQMVIFGIIIEIKPNF